jgi:hypothetical protein
MAITNRDKDVSEQKDVVQINLGAVATAATRHVLIAPYPFTLQSVRSSAQGVSNAMQVAFEKMTGAGSSGIPIGISNMILQNRSTSGVIGFSGLAATGSTLLNFAAGDVLQIVTSVSSGNATDLSLQLILKKTQDIVSHNGVAT